jgi:hypothetical protein
MVVDYGFVSSIHREPTAVNINTIEPGELIPDVGAAAALGVKRETLATWRSQGRGPAFVKIGRRVFYRRLDLHQFIAAQRREPGIIRRSDRP